MVLLEIQHILLNSVWSDGFAPGGTDYKSSHTCLQHCDIRSASQHWRALPNPGRAGGRAGGFRQADSTVWHRQDSETGSWAIFWWHPELIYPSPPFQTFKALRRCRRYQTAAEKQKGKLREMAACSCMVWSAPNRTKLLTCHQIGEAGSRTALKTRIARGGKYEISYHLLWSLNPIDMVLKEILTILFAVSVLSFPLKKLCLQSNLSDLWL